MENYGRCVGRKTAINTFPRIAWSRRIGLGKTKDGRVSSYNCLVGTNICRRHCSTSNVDLRNVNNQSLTYAHILYTLREIFVVTPPSTLTLPVAAKYAQEQLYVPFESNRKEAVTTSSYILLRTSFGSLELNWKPDELRIFEEVLMTSVKDWNVTEQDKFTLSPTRSGCFTEKASNVMFLSGTSNNK